MGSSFNPSFILAVTRVCLAGAAYNKYLYSLVTRLLVLFLFSVGTALPGVGLHHCFFNDAFGLFVPSPLLG